MLATVYSYRVMVKGVSSSCVRGRRVLSNPVTHGVGTENSGKTRGGRYTGISS